MYELIDTIDPYDDEDIEDFEKCLSELSGHVLVAPAEGECEPNWFYFYCGPEIIDAGQSRISALSFYEFLKPIMAEISEKYNVNFQVGCSENEHSFSTKDGSIIDDQPFVYLLDKLRTLFSSKIQLKL